MRKQPYQIGFRILVCIICIFSFLAGCKKENLTFSDIQDLQRPSRFFDVPPSSHFAIKDVANKMYRQNQKKEFISQFVKWNGHAMWDKAEVKRISTRNLPELSRSMTGDSVYYVLVPLMKDSSDGVMGYAQP